MSINFNQIESIKFTTKFGKFNLQKKENKLKRKQTYLRFFPVVFLSKFCPDDLSFLLFLLSCCFAHSGCPVHPQRDIYSKKKKIKSVVSIIVAHLWWQWTKKKRRDLPSSLPFILFFFIIENSIYQRLNNFLFIHLYQVFLPHTWSVEHHYDYNPFLKFIHCIWLKMMMTMMIEWMIQLCEISHT